MSPRDRFVFSLRGPEPAGAEILAEVPGDPVGFFAFRVYRMGGIWLSTKPTLRSTVFHAEDLEKLAIRIADRTNVHARSEGANPGAGLVLLLAEMIRPEPNLPAMAHAALTVAEWAFGRKHVRTALAFSRLAAALANTSRFAWLAARHHRNHGYAEESEIWFRVAHAAATRERDWDTKARSIMGLGVLSFNSGSYPRARHRFEFALRVARKYHVRERLGDIHHHLFTVSMAMTDHAMAEREAQLVREHYEPSHPRLPHFMHDLAAYRTERGDYANALLLLRQLLARNAFAHEPDSKLLTYAWSARAAAGAGDLTSFARFFAEARERVGAAAEGSLAVAQALLLLARGALLLERRNVARTCLMDALAEAKRTGQEYVRSQSEKLLATLAA